MEAARDESRQCPSGEKALGRLDIRTRREEDEHVARWLAGMDAAHRVHGRGDVVRHRNRLREEIVKAENT